MSKSNETAVVSKEKMVNLVSKETKNGNIIISMEESKYYYLPFDKSPIDLSDPKIRNSFIKSVEKLVRTSNLYKRYINYLKSDIGLTHCAVFGNIKADKNDKTKIEMHHGPIFTLYDYVSIVLEKHLSDIHNEINTFDIAAEVLELHRRKLVQTVMLSQSVHIAMDNKKLAPFIPLDMTFGNLKGFIEEYGQWFSPQNRADLKKYFMNYKANLAENKLNMFKPIFTKYNIKFVENKPHEEAVVI
jgi:hypothetical protein